MKELDDYLKSRQSVFEKLGFNSGVISPYIIIKDYRNRYWKRGEDNLIIYAHCRKEVWMGGNIAFYLKKYDFDNQGFEKTAENLIAFVGNECTIDPLKEETDISLFIFDIGREVKKRGTNFKKFQNACQCVLCADKECH